jgi:hypothetical protein
MDSELGVVNCDAEVIRPGAVNLGAEVERVGNKWSSCGAYMAVELGAKICSAEVTALVLCYHVAFGACGGNTHAHVVACTRP